MAPKRRTPAQGAALAGARQAKEARRLEINLEMNRDADHHAQRVPIPAAGAVDEEPPVGMALSGPPSEGPQAAVHAGMALSGPPSEGSQAAVHDEPDAADQHAQRVPAVAPGG
jgi:hypothetical protein